MLQQDEPLLALNVILGVFTIVSFTKLCADVCSSNKQQSSKAYNALHNELREIRLAMEQVNEQITDMRLQLQEQQEQQDQQSETSQGSQTEEEEQEQAQEEVTAPAPAVPAPAAAPAVPAPAAAAVPAPAAPAALAAHAHAHAHAEQQQTQEQKQKKPKKPKKQEQSKALVINEIKPVSPKQADKHAQLIASLKNNEEVSMTYKKQTFTATFIVRSDSQHGYVLKSGTAEYNTPSDFSRGKKITINNKIKSDNGWDTVTVQRNGNKLTLNELIGQ